jgi:pyruvate ferredoxin oxidoreductase gamma subunit
MFQVRIHGRGGQGVVTAAELLSIAAFLEGKHAQAFPSFGSERTGSPVVSFCRIDDKEIRLREPILEPDGLIVQVNTNKGFDELHLSDVVAKLPNGHARVSPATELALKHIGRPVPNVALLGAFAALTGIVHLHSVITAIRQTFSGKLGEANVAAATAAYEGTARASAAA